MDNRITVRFFRITPTHDAAPKFEDSLKAAMKAGETPKARERSIGQNAIVRLERLAKEGAFVDGEIIRRQMSNFPPEANDAGLVRLPLADGSGLGHCIAFRYSVGLRVIAIQFDNRAVSVGRLLGYLKALDSSADYRAAPIARSDAWDRYNRGEPRKFIIQIANPTALDKVEGEVYDVSESSTRLADIYQGPIIRIEVSMGHRKGSLAREAIERTINYFTKGGGKEADVRTLSVDVQPPEGGSAEPVDFIEEFLMTSDRFDLPESNPDGHYNIRRSFIKTCFNENLDHIMAVYGGAQ